MKCEHCHEREATVRIKQNINGAESEQFLCPQCAAAQQSQYSVGDFDQFENFFSSPAFGKSWLGDLFGHAGIFSDQKPLTDARSGDTACPECGFSIRDINSTGLLGCPYCYKHFEPALRSLFQRLQRGSQHVGRKPGRRGSADDQVVATGKVAVKPEEKTQSSEKKIHLGTDETEKRELSEQEHKINELKKQQDAAVAREDYLEAARLRDEIKALRTGKEEDK
ncbi:MAG TPA: hypothetical protein GX717_06925 [Clostridiaceae bacterium]|nr:hypothetical protein [Clostridiaceae bacterium]